MKCRFNSNIHNPYNQSKQEVNNPSLDLTPVIDLTNKFMDKTNETINDINTKLNTTNEVINEVILKFNNTNEVVLSLNNNFNIIANLVEELRQTLNSHITEQIPINQMKINPSVNSELVESDSLTNENNEKNINNNDTNLNNFGLSLLDNNIIIENNGKTFETKRTFFGLGKDKIVEVKK